MDVREFVRVLRARRWIVVATLVLVLVAVGAATALTRPTFESSARLYVSSSGTGSVNDLYQGNLFSQQRVMSYAEILTGRTLAQRAIDSADIAGIDADTLASRVSTTTKPETVLITVTVADRTPSRATTLVNAVADEFTVMAEELETPEDGTAPRARVIVEQHAVDPGAKTSPRPVRNLLLGGVLGLILGILLAVARDRFDSTLSRRDAVEDAVDARVLASVPFDKARRAHPAILFRDEVGPGTEAYRELRTNLRFLDLDDPPRTIVVTSAVPGEGKTTTAVNLALVLAEAGYSVALVEADMRRPRVTRYLDMPDGPGVSSLFDGNVAADDITVPTRFERLSLVRSGPLPPNPSELLGTRSARRLIGELRERFDYVVIDAPPLSAVTDAVVLTALADGAIVVVRHGRTTHEEASRAVRSLRAAGARVLGAVRTMTPTDGRAARANRPYHAGRDDREGSDTPST